MWFCSALISLPLIVFPSWMVEHEMHKEDFMIPICRLKCSMEVLEKQKQNTIHKKNILSRLVASINSWTNNSIQKTSTA